MLKNRLIFCMSLLVWLGYESVAQISFEEIGSSTGIQFGHVSDNWVGGGVAVFDFDKDGWQDIYLTGGDSPDKLLKNVLGQGFEDVSDVSGISSITSEYKTFGVTTGDIDNDGFRDILVTTEFGYRSILIKNLGNGTFEHLPIAINDGVSWKSAAAFGDVNKDGFLDLYIGAYIYQSDVLEDSTGTIVGFDQDCSSNKLFLNTGSLAFVDASSQYSVQNQGCALAVAFTDYDSDIDLDLIVANDFGEWNLPSALISNEFPNQEFEDISAETGMDLEIYGMGIAIGDYDKDADLDYYQTNLGRNILSRNDSGIFTDVTTQANCESDSTGQLLNTGWGTFFFDADNDSWQDLFVANGWVNTPEFIATYPNDPNVLFKNNGDGTFSDISESSDINSTRNSKGAAYGDFNNDGKLDFVVNNVHPNPDSAQFEIYQNTSSNTGNWISFKLEGTLSNRDAFGSKVRVVVNGQSSVAEVSGGCSFASQNSSIIHFGIGDANQADSVIVTFLSGQKQVFSQVESNQLYHIVEDFDTSTRDYTQEDAISSGYIDGEFSIWTNSGIGLPVEIEIVDMSGRSLCCNKMTKINSPLKLSSLVTLSTGLYAVFIKRGNVVKAFKFFKSK